MSQAIFNLWHLKRTNGMYYFGLDYAQRLPFEWVVWVRPGFPIDGLKAVGFKDVRELRPLAYMQALWRAHKKSLPLFCPSSHPIPFIAPQVIIVHDSYPFQRGAGLIKRWLLRRALSAQGMHAGYINHVDSRRFLLGIGMQERAMFYTPNFMGVSPRTSKEPRVHPPRLTIGLIGTDSEKKRYEMLFDEVRGSRDGARSLAFKAYGHETAYFSDLKAKYSDLNVDLVSSDDTVMSTFLGNVDIIVSVSRGEGFCRPVARALASGVPCWLLEDEVFREFYDGYADFSPSVADLVSKLLAASKDHGALHSGQGDEHIFPPPHLSQAFQAAVKAIEAVMKKELA